MPSGLFQHVGETGWQLSHGERARLFLARALLQRSELLILDESFGALDPMTLKQCMDTVLARAIPRRDYAPMKRSRVAIVSLLPDPGHVIPLLRIGAVLREGGIDVRCHVPNENLPLCEEHGLDGVGIGDFRSPLRTRAAKTFGFSRRRPFGYPGRLDDYFLALSSSAARAMPRLREAIADLTPDALLADAHGFRVAYERLAKFFDVPLVLHVSDGAVLQGTTRVRASVRPGLARAMFGVADLARRKLSRFSPSRRRMEGELATSLMENVPVGEVEAKVVQIASGLAMTERARFAVEDPVAPPASALPDALQLFGPVFPRGSGTVSSTLGSWLSERKDVLYICLGNMMRPTRPFVTHVIHALEDVGVQGLWVVPSTHGESIARLPSSPLLRFERSAPQREILERAAVRACLTHAGAGTVQECLLAGKPLLCAPVCWDQFYNAAVVEALGAGVQIDLRRTTGKTLAATLRRVLDAECAMPAERVKTELLAQDGIGRMLGFWQELLPGASRAARTMDPGRS